MHLTCPQMSAGFELNKDYNFSSGGSKIYGSPPTVLIGVNCVPVRIVSK